MKASLLLGLGVDVVRLVDYHAGQVVAAASKGDGGRALQALSPVHVLLPGHVRHLLLWVKKTTRCQGIMVYLRQFRVAKISITGAGPGMGG